MTLSLLLSIQISQLNLQLRHMYITLSLKPTTLLDNSARINKPSTVGQNWRWRLKKTQLTKKLQKEICQLTARYGRMNWA